MGEIVGGAKFLGNAVSVPMTISDGAMNGFLMWVVCSPFLLLALAICVLNKPSFLIPFVTYIVGCVFFFILYLYCDYKDCMTGFKPI